MTARISLLMLAAIALTSIPALDAWSHHGWSEYDGDNTLKLTGTIVAASYSSPHGTATLRTTEKTWSVVLAPPSRMTNRGLTPEMLREGTEVSVEGYPHRSNPAELRAERITIAGKTIELR